MVTFGLRHSSQPLPTPALCPLRSAMFGIHVEKRFLLVFCVLHPRVTSALPTSYAPRMQWIHDFQGFHFKFITRRFSTFFLSPCLIFRALCAPGRCYLVGEIRCSIFSAFSSSRIALYLFRTSTVTLQVLLWLFRFSFVVPARLKGLDYLEGLE